jgi:hypothetical protein
MEGKNHSRFADKPGIAALRNGPRGPDDYKEHMRDVVIFLLSRSRPDENIPILAALVEATTEIGICLTDEQVTVDLLRRSADRLDGELKGDLE